MMRRGVNTQHLEVPVPVKKFETKNHLSATVPITDTSPQAEKAVTMEQSY